MRKELEDNYFLHLPKFIDADVAAKLASEFEGYADVYGSKGDDMIDESQALYDFPSMIRMLVQKTPTCSVLAGEALLPTYTYGRVYKNGAELKPHVDREACEVSLTINLSKTVDWPIYVTTSNGTPVGIELSPGDAIMYLGTKTKHWRPKYTGDHHVQVFMHYVRAHGENAWAYFDKTQIPPPRFRG